MAKAITLEPTATEAMELQAMIERYLIEGKHLSEQMARDQETIDRLKFETGLIAAETRAMMEDLQSTLARLRAI